MPPHRVLTTVRLQRAVSEGFGLGLSVDQYGVVRVCDADEGTPAARAISTAELRIGCFVESINGTRILPGADLTALLPTDATILTLTVDATGELLERRRTSCNDFV